MNPQQYGQQSVFNEIDQCTQPRFVHVPIFQAFNPVQQPQTYTENIDLTLLVQQKQIDSVQGIVIALHQSLDNIRQVESNAINTYAARIDVDGGFFVPTAATDNDGDGYVGVYLMHPLFSPNPSRLNITFFPSDQSGLTYVRADVYLTNFRVRPFTCPIKYAFQE